MGNIPTQIGLLSNLISLTFGEYPIDKRHALDVLFKRFLAQFLIYPTGMSVPKRNLDDDGNPEPIPTEVGLLTSLKWLNLGHDQTVELPSELAMLSNLESFTSKLM